MRAWLEIDMDNLKYNLDKIKELVHGTNVLGVIKANSYGFGAIETAKELSKHGVEIFGVASLEEAMELREGGIEEEILILGSLFNDEIEIAAEKHFQITISSMRQVEFLESNKIDAEIHIKIDTGMGRLGFTPEKGKEAVVALLKDDVEKSIKGVEALMKSKFGDVENPLLVSVRSGARASMPGMMDTILNLGLNDEVVEGLVSAVGFRTIRFVQFT